MNPREASVNVLAVWAITGYPLLSVVSDLFHLDNHLISLWIRCAVVAFSLLVIPYGINSVAKTIVGLFIAFWAIYLSRLYIVTEIEHEVLSQENYFYWMWALGACVVPTLAVLLNGEQVNLNRIVKILQLCMLGIMLVLLVRGDIVFVDPENRDYIISDLNPDDLRLNLETLNPISIGSLAVRSVILGTFGLLESESVYFAIAGLINIVLGLRVLLLANSRGPLISLLLCIAVFMIVSRKYLNLSWKKLSLILGLTAAYLFYVVSYSSSRLVQVIGSDINSIDRVILWAGALSQFTNNVLFGDGIEVRFLSDYPHNLILEALMSTGIIGTIFFVAYFVRLFYIAKPSFTFSASNWWLAYVALAAFSAALFSGGIYASGEFWVLTALVVTQRSISQTRGLYQLEPK
jgi:O-antigen ligase